MPPAPDPAPDRGEDAAPPAAPRRRRHVYATRGLAASVAVLALSVQAGQLGGVPAPIDDTSSCVGCDDPAGPDADHDA